MVAAQRVLSNREGLIDDPYAEPLVRAVGLDFFVRMLDGEIAPEEFTQLDPRFNLRRAAEGMAVRTRHFDRLFTDAADTGVRQAVILAAGLDARAYRLPWPDGTTVYELDQPEVIAFKTETLAGLGAEPRADRRAIAVDLRDDWPKVLLDNGFDPSQPTAWIAEGLLIYLPASAQEQLFTGIDSLAGPGSHVAVEDGAPMQTDDYEAALEEERAAAAEGDGRVFFQLLYNQRHAPATEWLSKHGWNAVGTPLADYLRHVGHPVPGPDVEAGPMIARNTLVSAVRA
jgi:methyltransferase (TIGR00027 family)